MTEKTLKIILIIVFMLAIPSLLVFAEPATTVTLDNPLGEESILGIINRGLSVLLWLSMTLGVFVVMWAGFLYITSQGKSDKAAAAAKVVVNVLIGIAIVLLAKGIVNLTYRVLTGSSLEQNTVPTKQLTPVSTINLPPFP